MRSEEQIELALAILDSEAFMWLMVGSRHQDSWLNQIRPTYNKYSELGGGWGKGNGK